MPEAAGGGGAQPRRSSDRQDGRLAGARRDQEGLAAAARPARGAFKTSRLPSSGERFKLSLPTSWRTVVPSSELYELVGWLLCSLGLWYCRAVRFWLVFVCRRCCSSVSRWPGRSAALSL